MTKADQAFTAHAAMLKAQAADPSLRDNPFWVMLRNDAYERFHIEFIKPDIAPVTDL